MLQGKWKLCALGFMLISLWPVIILALSLYQLCSLAKQGPLPDQWCTIPTHVWFRFRFLFQVNSKVWFQLRFRFQPVFCWFHSDSYSNPKSLILIPIPIPEGRVVRGSENHVFTPLGHGKYAFTPQGTSWAKNLMKICAHWAPGVWKHASDVRSSHLQLTLDNRDMLK